MVLRPRDKKPKCSDYYNLLICSEIYTSYYDKVDDVIELKTKVFGRLKSRRLIKTLKRAKDLYDDEEPADVKESILNGNQRA